MEFWSSFIVVTFQQFFRASFFVNFFFNFVFILLKPSLGAHAADCVTFLLNGHGCLIRNSIILPRHFIENFSKFPHRDQNARNLWINTKTIFRRIVAPISRANFTKWSNTLKQFVGNLQMNYLSVFGHFVGLVFKGLSYRWCHR